MKKPPLRILLADDDETDRLIFQEALQELKMETVIHIVKDGIELMEYLTKKNTRLPHLLFLDLNMPRKNGLECLEEIRRTEKIKGLIIAIYSTSTSEKDIEDTFNAGANVYITKPNEYKMLKLVLKKAVNMVIIHQKAPFNRENFLLRI